MPEEKNIFERNNITDANLAFEYAKQRAAEGNYTPEIAQEKINKFMDYYYDYEDNIADENDMLNSMSDSQKRNKFIFNEIDSYNYKTTDKYNKSNLKTIRHENEDFWSINNFLKGTLSGYNGDSSMYSDNEFFGAIIAQSKENFYNAKDNNNMTTYSKNRTINVGDIIMYPRIKDKLLDMYNNEGYIIERSENGGIIISKDGENWVDGITFNDDTNSFTIPNDNEQFLRFAKLYGDAKGKIPDVLLDTGDSFKIQKDNNNNVFTEQRVHNLLMDTYKSYLRAKNLSSVDFKELRPDFSVNVTTFSNSDLASYSWGIDFQHGMLKNEYFNTLKKDHDARIKGSIMAQNPTDIPNGALYALCDGTIIKLSQEEATEVFTKIKSNLDNVNIGFASPAGHNSGVCLSYAGLRKDSKVFKGYEEVQIFAEGMFNNDPYVQAYDKDPSTRARKKLELWAGQHNLNIGHSIRFGNKNVFELHCSTNSENGKPMYAINVNGKLKPISQDDALSIYTASLSLQDNIRQYQMYKNNMGNEEKEATIEIYKQWRDNNLKPLLENKIYGRKLTDEEFSSITSTIYDEYFGDYFHK